MEFHCIQSRPIPVDVVHDIDSNGWRGLYFLLKGKELVYIGMSGSSVVKRVKDHIREGSKDFDAVQFYTEQERNKYSDEHIHQVERIAINKYVPKYNIQLRSYNKEFIESNRSKAIPYAL